MHKTVLLNEAIDNLNIKEDGIYVDCTLGFGGHSGLILERIKRGFLFAFDQDDMALEYSEKKLKEIGSNFELIKSNFAYIKEELNKRNVTEVDGIVFDLGVSSPQLDIADRGFSFHKDAKLDMRMDTTKEFSAYNVVNEYSYEELVRVIRDYGEEKYATSIAKNIVKDRESKPIETTFELVDIIKKSMPYKAMKDSHPARRTFQAIRIEVNNELEVLKKENCDFIVSIGGGSPQDCGKAISVLATNGGKITDYEGVNKSQKKCLPIVAIATTAGTSAEVTINYVITDEETHIKMIMVDRNTLASITVNDPELMLSKPAGLTAATGMDALTHAMEAVVANGAIDVTDATALYAIKQIFEYLPRAVENGQDIEAREQMCYACFLNGIAFSNAGLGNVHAMAHQLGGLYDLPHGVCNAMLLPIVEEENAKQAPAKFRVMAETIGMDVEGKTDEECMDFVIGKIKELSERVGIPKTLSELGVENPDFETLAENSMKDACAGANPVFFDKELLIKLFKKIA